MAKVNKKRCERCQRLYQGWQCNDFGCILKYCNGDRAAAAKMRTARQNSVEAERWRERLITGDSAE